MAAETNSSDFSAILAPSKASGQSEHSSSRKYPLGERR